MEESLQTFNETHNFTDFVQADTPIIRDACSFHKHKTENIFLQYDGSRWTDITLYFNEMRLERILRSIQSK